MRHSSDHHDTNPEGRKPSLWPPYEHIHDYPAVTELLEEDPPVLHREKTKSESQSTVIKTCSGKSGAGHGSQVLQRSRGACPLVEDYCEIVHDYHGSKIYIFTSDNAETPTEYVSSCAVETMTWEDITDHLSELKLEDPFATSTGEQRMQAMAPPRRVYAGRTLLRIRNKSYLLLFGGFNPVTGRASADTIVIDPESRKWWILRPEGGDVLPRIDPTIVAIDRKVYIFGGYRRFGDNPQMRGSYSILEYVPHQGIWRWAVKDKLYSGPILPSSVIGRAFPVYGGTRILLSPGRLTKDEPINLSKRTLFFFNTHNRSFEYAGLGLAGDFPNEVSWYYFLGPGVTTSWESNEEVHSPSIFLCAWIKVAGTEDVCPEIWEISFAQNKAVCLHVSRMVWNLDTEFEECFYHGPNKAIRILGSKSDDKPRGRSRTLTRKHYIIDSESEGSNSSETTLYKNDDAKWNVYYDIPLLGK